MIPAFDRGLALGDLADHRQDIEVEIAARGEQHLDRSDVDRARGDIAACGVFQRQQQTQRGETVRTRNAVA